MAAANGHGAGRSVDLTRDTESSVSTRPTRTIVFDDNDDLDVPDFLK
jgi:hypothetical protein